MPATFTWEEGHGTTPTIQSPAANVNWKSVNDYATAVASAKITAGQNSYEKFTRGKFTSGTFTGLDAGKYQHTGGTADTGISLYGSPSAASAMRAWATPVTTASTLATVDITSITAIGSSTLLVYFGGTDSEPAGKGVTADGTATRYTNWIVTQLQTSGAAGGGVMTSLTLTLRYDEN